jgi:hypothetical protein
MIRFFKNLFKGKDPGPAPEAPYKVEAPAAKVEAVNAQPVVAEVAPAKPATKAPAKKRTFVKREEGGVAKVAPVKAKPKAPAKPRTPKAK